MSADQDKWQKELDESNQYLTDNPDSAEWTTYRTALLTMRDRVDYREEPLKDVSNWPKKPGK